MNILVFLETATPRIRSPHVELQTLLDFTGQYQTHLNLSNNLYVRKFKQHIFKTSAAKLTNIKLFVAVLLVVFFISSINHVPNNLQNKIELNSICEFQGITRITK